MVYIAYMVYIVVVVIIIVVVVVLWSSMVDCGLREVSVGSDKRVKKLRLENIRLMESRIFAIPDFQKKSNARVMSFLLRSVSLFGCLAGCRSVCQSLWLSV